MIITMPLDECKSHREDRRFRELYRYFQPSNPAALLYSPFADAADATPGNPGPSLAIGLPAQDLSSANTILTTFAQTATLKLNTDRAIIRYALFLVEIMIPVLIPLI